MVDSEISKYSFHWIVLQVTISSVKLKSIIDDIEAFFCCKPLCHCAIHCFIWVIQSHAISTVPYHKSACLKISCHFCKSKLNILISWKRLSKLLSFLYVLGGMFQAKSSSSKRATCDIKSSTIESWKSDFESLSLFSKKVFFWNFDIIKHYHSCWLNVPTHFTFICSIGKTFHSIF